MQLTVLIDNLCNNEQFAMEHGLSFYIETIHSKILFDTGQSGAFIRNANKLGIQISEINYLVLSHGHFDHSGGIEDFLRCNAKAKILLKPEALLPKYNNSHYIGVPHSMHLQDKRVLKFGAGYQVDDVTEIVGKIDIKYPEDTHYEHFFIRTPDEFIPDTFQDEVFLALKTDNSLAIISGCSHNGITNILHTAQTIFNEPVRYVFGGFHLKDSGSEAVTKTAGYLNTINLKRIVTGHCTGMENYILLKNMCNAEVNYSFTGSTYNF